MAEVKRGEIYFIKRTGDTVGSEQRADRPAVVVSNNKNNKNSEVIEVAYMTTKPKKGLPTHFITNEAMSRSTVLCEQVNSISIDRVAEWIGTLSSDEMKKLDECLAVSLGIGKVQKKQEHEKESKENDTKEQDAAKIWKKQAETYKGLYEYILGQQLEGAHK